MTRDKRYLWLAPLLEEVRTRKFFSVQPVPDEDLERVLNWDLPLCYKGFVREIGDARLFRELDGYVIGVYCPPKPEEDVGDRKAVVFGHYDSAHLCFDAGDGRQSAVFRVDGDRLTKISDTFDNWLQDSVRRARKRYSAREWRRICAGPRPFTRSERDIVRARRRYSWERLGTTEDGRLKLLIRNESDRHLPFLTIGVRSSDLLGAAWVPVDDIRPGQSKAALVDCYKDIVDPENVELYPLPDPGPEDRDRYWEFKQLRSAPKEVNRSR